MMEADLKGGVGGPETPQINEGSGGARVMQVTNRPKDVKHISKILTF